MSIDRVLNFLLYNHFLLITNERAGDSGITHELLVKSRTQGRSLEATGIIADGLGDTTVDIIPVLPCIAL
jgi:hypothetical protein